MLREVALLRRLYIEIRTSTFVINHSQRNCMDLDKELQLTLTRRQLFSRTSVGIGTAALASLLSRDFFAETPAIDPKTGGLADLPHFAAKAKRVIFLHQSGAPSQ